MLEIKFHLQTNNSRTLISTKYVDLSRYRFLLIKFVRHSSEIFSCLRIHDHSLILTSSDAIQGVILTASGSNSNKHTNTTAMLKVLKLFYSRGYCLPPATLVTRKPKKKLFRTTDYAQNR